MPKISEAKRDARRGEIIDAALRCFDRNGYHRTSMADIIAESGLSAGAIYSYFPSKDELVRQVSTRIIAERQDELDDAGARHPLAPAEIVTVLLEGIRRNAPLPLLVQVWGEAAVDAELRLLFQSALGTMRSTIRRALERWAQANPASIEGDPGEWAAAAAPALIGLIPGFVLQSVMFDEFDADAYLAALPRVLPHTPDPR